MLLFMLFAYNNVSYAMCDGVVDSLKYRRVCVRSDFSTGSIDSVYINGCSVDALNGVFGYDLINNNCQSSQDTIKIRLTTRFDPVNPLKPDRPGARRWFNVRLDGIRDLNLLVDIDWQDAVRPFYSVDGRNFVRMSEYMISTPDGTMGLCVESDSLWLSYFVPYSLGRLHEVVDRWSANSMVEVKILGQTEQGKDLIALKISNDSANSCDKADKKLVYMQARVHPSESPSSWLVESLVDKILDDAKLLEGLEFWIVPMVNPDGVEMGLSRSNSLGYNIEENWDSPDSITSVEVRMLSALFDSIQFSCRSRCRFVDLALNIHAQSSPKATFFVHNVQSSSIDWHSRQSLLAHQVAQECEWLSGSDISESRLRDIFVEKWLYKKTKGNTLAVTFELPYTYYGANQKGKWVELSDMPCFSDALLKGICRVLGVGGEYIGQFDIESILKKPCVKLLDVEDGWVCFDNSCIDIKSSCPKSVRRINYDISGLETGVYDVFAWEPGRFMSDDSNRWVPLEKYKHKTNRDRYVLRPFRYDLSRVDKLIFVPVE